MLQVERFFRESRMLLWRCCRCGRGFTCITDGRLALRLIHITATELNWTNSEHVDNCELPVLFNFVPAIRTGLRGEPSVLSTSFHHQRCWRRHISLRQPTVVDADHRGGWTQIFGGKAPEPKTFRPVENLNFCLPLAFGAPVGVTLFEF